MLVRRRALVVGALVAAWTFFVQTAHAAESPAAAYLIEAADVEEFARFVAKEADGIGLGGDVPENVGIAQRAALGMAQASLDEALRTLDSVPALLDREQWTEADVAITSARTLVQDADNALDGILTAPMLLSALGDQALAVFPGIILVEGPKPVGVASADVGWPGGLLQDGRTATGSVVVLTDVSIRDPVFGAVVGATVHGTTVDVERVALGTIVHVQKALAVVSPVVARDLDFLKHWVPPAIDYSPMCSGECGCATCLVESTILAVTDELPQVGYCDVAPCPQDFLLREGLATASKSYGVRRLPLPSGSCEDVDGSCLSADEILASYSTYLRILNLIVEYHAAVAVPFGELIPKSREDDYNSAMGELAANADDARAYLTLVPSLVEDGEVVEASASLDSAIAALDVANLASRDIMLIGQALAPRLDGNAYVLPEPVIPRSALDQVVFLEMDGPETGSHWAGKETRGFGQQADEECCGDASGDFAFGYLEPRTIVIENPLVGTVHHDASAQYRWNSVVVTDVVRYQGVRVLVEGQRLVVDAAGVPAGGITVPSPKYMGTGPVSSGRSPHLPTGGACGTTVCGQCEVCMPDPSCDPTLPPSNFARNFNVMANLGCGEDWLSIVGSSLLVPRRGHAPGYFENSFGDKAPGGGLIVGDGSNSGGGLDDGPSVWTPNPDDPCGPTAPIFGQSECGEACIPHPMMDCADGIGGPDIGSIDEVPDPPCGLNRLFPGGCDPTVCDPLPAAIASRFAVYSDPWGLVVSLGPGMGDVIPPDCLVAQFGPNDAFANRCNQAGEEVQQRMARLPAHVRARMLCGVPGYTCMPIAGDLLVCSGDACVLCDASTCRRASVTAALGRRDTWVLQWMDENGGGMSDWPRCDEERESGCYDEELDAVIVRPNEDNHTDPQDPSSPEGDESEVDCEEDPRACVDPGGPDLDSNQTTTTAPGLGETAGDPVAMLTGHESRVENDLSLVGTRGIELSFGRRYVSGQTGTTALGRNWSHNFQSRVEVVHPGTPSSPQLPRLCFNSPWVTCLIHHAPDGTRTVFIRDSDRSGDTSSGRGPRDVFVPSAGAFGIMRSIRVEYDDCEHDGYELRHPDGSFTEFRQDGRVQRYRNRLGGVIEYRYEGLSRLVQRVDGSGGVWFEFDYAGPDSGMPGPTGTLRRVRTSDGREIEFCYEQQRRERGVGRSSQSVPELSCDDVGVPRSTSIAEAAGFLHPDVPQVVLPGFLGAARGTALNLGHLSSMRLRDVTVRGGSDFTTSRYTYSDRSTDTEFLQELAVAATGRFEEARLAGRLPADVSREESTDECEPRQGGGLSQLMQWFFAELASVEGQIISVQRFVHDADTLHTSALAGSWVTELEQRFDWDPHSPTFRRVLEQRFGGEGVDPAFPEPDSNTTLWTIEPALTDLPLTAIEYFLSVDDYLSDPDAPKAVWIEEGMTAVGAQWAERSCEDIQRTARLYENDLVRLSTAAYSGVPAPLFPDRFLHGRERIQTLAGRACAVVVERREGEPSRVVALNFLGLPIVEILWDGTAEDLYARTATAYNADGNQTLHVDTHGQTHTYVYPEEVGLPSLRMRPTVAASEGNDAWWARMPLLIGPDFRTEFGPADAIEEFVYDPVTLQEIEHADADDVARLVRLDYFSDEVLREAVEFEFGAFGLDTDWLTSISTPQLAGSLLACAPDAPALMSRFPDVLPGLPVQRVGDAPLESGSVAGVCPTTDLQWNADGSLASVADRWTGQRRAFEYVEERVSRISDTVWEAGFDAADWDAIPGVAAPWLVASGAGVDFGQECNGSARVQQADVVWDGSGRVASVEYQNGTKIRYAYDGLGRQNRVIDPAGQSLFAYNHFGVVSREIRVDATATTLEAADVKRLTVADRRVYYDSYGNRVAGCDALAVGGCQGDLSSLLSRAASSSPRTSDHAQPVEAVQHDDVSPDGRLLARTDAEGSRRTLAYDGLGRPVRDEFGQGSVQAVREYEYGAPSGLVPPGPTRERVVDPTGSAAPMEFDVGYDSLGRMLAYVDENGVATITASSAGGRLIRRQVIGTDGRTFEVSEHFDRGGALAKTVTTRLVTPVADQAYEPSSGPHIVQTGVRDLSGRVVYAELRDGSGELDPVREWRGLDSSGRVRWHSDEWSAQGECDAPSLDRVTSWRAGAAAPNGGATVFSGNDAVSMLDWAGRPVSTTLLSESATGFSSIEYDSLGRAHVVHLPSGRIETRHFDDGGRLVALTHEGVAGGPVRSMAARYDRLGMPVAIEDYAGRTRTIEYDALHRVRRVNEPAEEGEVRTFVADFDGLGRPIRTGQQTAAESLPTTTYLPGTSVVNTEVATGFTVLHESFDALGRATRVSRSERGRTVTVEQELAATGELLHESVSLASDGVLRDLWAAEHTFDVYGRRRSSDVGDGFSEQRGFDLGMLAWQEFGGTNPFDVAYLNDGAGVAKQTITFGSTPAQLVHDRSVDEMGRFNAVSGFFYGGDGDVQRIASSHITRQGDGRIEEFWSGVLSADGLVEGVGRRANYRQDADWLASTRDVIGEVAPTADAQVWPAAGTSVAYQYSPDGSLVGETGDGASAYHAELGLGDELELLTTSVGDAGTLLWDAAGRLLRTQDGRELNWAADDRLLEVDAITGGTKELVYDGWGRQVAEIHTLGSGESFTVSMGYVGAHVVVEQAFEGLVGSACFSRQTYYGAGVDEALGHSVFMGEACDALAAALGIADPDTLRAEGQTFAYVRDAMGSVTATVADTGDVLDRASYSAHGERRSSSGELEPSCSGWCASASGVSVGYRGMRFDRAVGAYDARNRWFDPSMRRFWSLDPMMWVDSFDRWTYAAGDPINFADPFGLAARPPEAGGAGGDHPVGETDRERRQRERRERRRERGGGGGGSGWLPDLTPDFDPWQGGSGPGGNSDGYDPWSGAGNPFVNISEMALPRGLGNGADNLTNRVESFIQRAIQDPVGTFAPNLPTTPREFVTYPIDEARRRIDDVLAIPGAIRQQVNDVTDCISGRNCDVVGEQLIVAGLEGSAATGLGLGSFPGWNVVGRFCFVAGTMVLLEDGTWKPIEEIEVGDVVVAWSAVALKTAPFRTDASKSAAGVTLGVQGNARRGENQERLVAREVVDVMPREAAGVVRLEYRTSEGESLALSASAVLMVTPEHPVYSLDSGHFIPAGELVVGDRIMDWQGGAQTIVATRYDPGSVSVYNFEVEGDHTYVVSPTAELATSVVVHNARGGVCGLRPERGLLGRRKHGIHWTEGRARANATGIPQGQFGSREDVDWAVDRARTLEPGESAFFELPESHRNIVWMPGMEDPVRATGVWVRHNSNGVTVHTYPVP